MKNQTVKNAGIFFGIALIIVIFDQATKLLIQKNILLNTKKVIIPYFLNIVNIQNTGAGFSLFKNFTTALIWISIAVIGIILYYYPLISKDKKILYLCSFILGGTIGNLIDRIRLGAVTDFIDFRSGSLYFPTFNVADAFISLSAIGLIIYLWKKDVKEKK